MVDDAQLGLIKELGLVIVAFMLRTVMEKSVEKQRDLYMCLVDFERTFDMVRHELLEETSENGS